MIECLLWNLIFFYVIVVIATGFALVLDLRILMELEKSK